MGTDTAVKAKDAIRKKASALGFFACGFARAVPLESQAGFYSDSIRERRYAPLDYLRRYAEDRLDPGKVFPGVKTVISLLMNYFPPTLLPAEDNFIIGKYAYGKDHHKLIRQRLLQLVHFLQDTFPPCRARFFFDSGMVLEKPWAQRCGVGWQGKNTLIIRKNEGSFFHIGILFTNLEAEADPAESDHCGSCDKCLLACPTGALDHPYRLDMTRCISYHTIENRGEVPQEVRGRFNDRIYGCDICQDVCPYNRFSQAHTESDFLPSRELTSLRKKDWLAMDEVDFQRLFKDSCLARCGFSTLRRNMSL